MDGAVVCRVRCRHRSGFDRSLRSSGPPDASQGTGPNPATAERAVENRVALATSSLAGRNYRAAAAYAAEVLALEPGQQAAIRIHDEASGMLARFDAAIADARRLAAAGDVSGSTRALETARAIDASSPLVAEAGLPPCRPRACF